MIQAISQANAGKVQNTAFKGEPVAVQTKAANSNLERSPQSDTIVKENTKESKKSFTGWLIGAGVAIAGLGIYFLTRGKAGAKASDVAQEAASKAKDAVETVAEKVEAKASDTVQDFTAKTNDVVETVTEKVETKVSDTVSSLKTEKKVKEKPTEVLNPDKIIISPKEPKAKGKPKNKTKPQVIEIKPKPEEVKPKVEVQPNSQSKAKPKIEEQPPKTSTEQLNRQVEDDNLLMAALLADDIAGQGGKKTSQVAEDLLDGAATVGVKKSDDLVEDFFGKPVNDPFNLKTKIFSDPDELNKPIDLIGDSYEDDISKIVDQVDDGIDTLRTDFYNSLDDMDDFKMFDDMTSSLDDIGNSLDDGIDFVLDFM